MSHICVEETKELFGRINMQGSKNTVLPIMASSILCSGVTTIYNCPDISDVHNMSRILESFGARIIYEDHVIYIDTTHIDSALIDISISRKLRSSIMMLGPAIGRFGEIRIGMPGGCNIGKRPIDIHLEALGKMNVGSVIGTDYIECKTYYLQGCDIEFRFPSVGATENVMMAACVANGKTVIHNAAREPEIIELAKHLTKMGAVIYGAGSDIISIYGTQKLKAAEYINVSDRIVAGTYMAAATMLPSNIELYNVYGVSYMDNLIRLFKQLGADIITGDGSIFIKSTGAVKAMDVVTGPYPMVPTDIQSMLLVAFLKSDANSTIKEGIFEGRYKVVEELKKFDAHIIYEDDKAIIYPGELKGTNCSATDLRGGAALVLAGLIAKGSTYVDTIDFIKRGYEDIVKDLSDIGVSICNME